LHSPLNTYDITDCTDYEPVFANWFFAYFEGELLDYIRSETTLILDYVVAGGIDGALADIL